MDCPLLEALIFLEKQAPRFSKIRAAIGKLRSRVSQGSSFAEALESSVYFPKLWASCLSNVPDDTIPKTLRILSRADEDQLQSKEISPYLFVILVIFLGNAIFLDKHVAPTFIELADKTGVDLLYLHLFKAFAPIALVILAIAYFSFRLYNRAGHELSFLSSLKPLDGLARTRRLLHSVNLVQIGLTTQVPGERLLDISLSKSNSALTRAAEGRYETLGDVYRKDPEFCCEDIAWLVDLGIERDNLEESLKLIESNLTERCHLLEKRSRVVLITIFFLTMSVLCTLMALAVYASLLELYVQAAPEFYLP